MAEVRNAYRILVPKSLRKHPLGRQRRKWEKILTWTFWKLCDRIGDGYNWLRTKYTGSFDISGVEVSGSVNTILVN
jgi:hypothetical protein